MKTLIKITTRLLLALLFVSLTNCEKDDNFIKEEIIETQTTNFKILIFNEDDYKNNSKLLDKVNKFKPKKQNTFSRTVYDSVYDFSVNTDHVKFVESLDGSIHSYTFEVIPEPNSTLIENLVFTLQPDGSYLSEFYQYEYLNNGDVEIKSADLGGLVATDYTQRSSATMNWKNTDLISTSQMESGVAGRWVMETNVTFTIDCTDIDGNCLVDNSGCDYCPECKDFTYITSYVWVDDNADVNIDEEGGGSGTGPTNGGSNGTPSNDDNPTDDDTTTTTVTTPTISFEQQILMCINGLMDDGVTIDPIVVSNIPTAQKSISMFLNSNGCSVEAQSFATVVTNIIESDSEVDFDNEIVYNVDQKCAKDVIKKTLNNTSALSQNILNYFSQDKDYVLNIINKDLPSNIAGKTSLTSECYNGICVIETELNNIMLNNSTDIFIAKIALHESIHATLTYLFVTNQFINQGLDPNSSSNPDYASLVDAYIEFLAIDNPSQIEATNINDLQHEYMTIFVDSMINSLQIIGSDLGYDSDTESMQSDFLRNLVWSGSFEETSYFNNPDNFSLYEADIVHLTGLAEFQNQSQSISTVDGNSNIVTLNISPIANQINNSSEPCY